MFYPEGCPLHLECLAAPQPLFIRWVVASSVCDYKLSPDSARCVRCHFSKPLFQTGLGKVWVGSNQVPVIFLFLTSVSFSCRKAFTFLPADDCLDIRSVFLLLCWWSLLLSPCSSYYLFADLFCVCMFTWEYVYVCAHGGQESILPFFYVPPRDWTQVVRLNSGHHYPLSHLISPFSLQLLPAPSRPECIWVLFLENIARTPFFC